MKITVLDFCTVTKKDEIDFSRLDALGEVRYADLVTEEEIIEKYSDTEIFLINKAKMTKKVISSCPNLKMIGTFATGYNNVDTIACKEYGVTLCNVPAYSTNAVAQHTFALLLNCIEHTDDYIASVDRGEWIKSKGFSYFAFPMQELYGKTMGIIGYGNIGQTVAKIANAFGMNVLIHNRSKKPCDYPLVDFETILKESDILSLHCPLTSENAKMIDETALSKMKKTALFLNTARGGLVDEQALADALNNGVIAGAGLDVMTDEPMKEGNPLLHAKNCKITPHVAWAPLETRERLFEVVLANVVKFMAGTPQNVIV